MDFHRLPPSEILGWPVLILVLCGLLSIVGGIGYGLWWLISHLAWVAS
jgi:hypothetical protein